MVGPVGIASLVFIRGFLSEEIVLTRIDLPSSNQFITSLRLAFTLASVSFFAVAVTKSNTQTSTPLIFVLVKAIIFWSGDHEKLAILGFSGIPFTSFTLAFFSLIFFI